MACGERFAFLLPPPCKGLGFGVLCSGEDFEIARAHVDEIKSRLIRVWNEIIAAENQRQSWPVAEKYRTAHDAWIARHDDLGWELFASASDFEEVRTLAEDGICLLDQMLNDAAQYGDEVYVPEEPYTPPPEPTAADELVDAGKTVILIAGVAIAFGLALAAYNRVSK